MPVILRTTSIFVLIFSQTIKDSNVTKFILSVDICRLINHFLFPPEILPRNKFSFTSRLVAGRMIHRGHNGVFLNCPKWNSNLAGEVFLQLSDPGLFNLFENSSVLRLSSIRRSVKQWGILVGELPFYIRQMYKHAPRSHTGWHQLRRINWSKVFLEATPSQLGSIRCKHNVRWQHVSRMKVVVY